MYRKLGSIAILLVLCTAGTANALSLDPEMAAPGATGLLGELWERLLDWFSRLGSGDDLTIQELEGCHIDPNGTCVPW